MKLLSFLAFLLFFNVLFAKNNPGYNQDYNDITSSLDFCSDWKFSKKDHKNAHNYQFNDENWQDVIIPHTWNANDMMPGMNGKKAYLGTAWYRKHFNLEQTNNNERYFLEFDAVGYVSKVFVDGKYIGGRNGGYLPFRLDITDALSDVKHHVVAVKVTNSYKSGYLPFPFMDWERYGGIHREVRLLKKGGAFFDFSSIQLRTFEVNDTRARVVIESRVWEKDVRSRELTIEHQLISPDGKIVSRVYSPIVTSRHSTANSKLEFPIINDPLLWSPDDPNLYRVESILRDGNRILDKECNPLGLRWFQFHPDNGFSINGKYLKLVGVNIHHEFPGLGNALPGRIQKHDIALMKEVGINFMRASHYPKSKHVLNACDELGIMILSENPFWHGSMRTKYGEELVEIIHRYTRELVETQNNHPSVIAWNTVNAIMHKDADGTGWIDENGTLQEKVLSDKEWPFAKRCIAEINNTFHRMDSSRPTSIVVGPGWDMSMKNGIIDLADMIALNGAALHKAPGGIRSYDRIKNADSNRVLIMSEGIINRTWHMYPDRGRANWVTEQEEWKIHANEWSLLYERPWFAGGAMWVFADYSAHGENRNMGIVDFSRLPYECFYFFKSMWTEQPMVHINSHWSWDDSKEKNRTVSVFTNCDKAELFLNEKSLGLKKPDTNQWPHLTHPPIQWNVPYESGELVVIAYKDDNQVKDIRITEGEPDKIVLSTDKQTLKSGKKDVCLITVKIVDKNGNRCYNSFDNLELNVNGKAKICGLSKIPVRGGLARFAVESINESGEISVIVKYKDISQAIYKLMAE